MRLAELLMRYPADTPQGQALRKAYKIDQGKTQEEVLSLEEKKAKIRARHRKPEKTLEQKKKEWKAKAEIDAEKQATISKTSELVSRRTISKDIDKTFVNIQNQQSDAFENKDMIEDYRNRAGIHLDMPSKYTKISKYMEHNLEKPEEREYFDKATLTKTWIEQHPEIKDLSQVSPDVLKRLDRAIVTSLLELRKKQNKKFLGIL
jgi:hypothetical protein